MRTGLIVHPMLALVLLAAGRAANHSDKAVPPHVELTRDGKTARVIVCAPDASAPEKTAAAELADYLKRITGATFPVVAPDQAQGKPVIAVGPGAALSVAPDLKLDKAVLGEDGIVRRTSGQNLILTGVPEAKRGAPYAVNQFLERSCGVRWGSSKAEHVPSSPSLTVAPPDQDDVPKLRDREVQSILVDRFFFVRE